MVLGETLILAALASASAILPGRWLGESLLRALVDADIIVDGLAFHLGWIPSLVAVVSALCAAVGGALVAGHRAARTRPTEALADAGSPENRPIGPWRIVLGLVLLAGGVALLVVTMTAMSGRLASTTGSPGAILMAIALAVLSPVLTRPLAALLTPVGALTGQAGRLAVINVRAGIDRTAAVAMPVVLLTGIATGLLYMHLTGKAAVHQEFVGGLAADAVIRVEAGADAPLPEQVAALPGVDAASEYVESTGFVERPVDDPGNWEGEDRWAGWELRGVTPDGVAAVMPGPVVEGSMDDLRGAAVALDADNAGELGVGPGDPMTLRMGDNAVLDVEVVALFTEPPGSDATLLLPADVLAGHTTEGRVTEIRVVGEDGVGTERMMAGLAGIAPEGGGTVVADRATLAQEYGRVQGTEAFAIYTIVAMIVTYTAISLVNVLASGTNARRREFGLQRLTGSTRGQVLRMLAIEGVLVAVIGVFLGTVAAAATLVSFSVGRTGTVVPTGSPLVYVGVVGVALLVTLLATLVPGRRVTRHRPVTTVAHG
ncbi:FtsX-like permease family protein [Nocardiopsis sp. MG754419]|uniref:FtsX-like permease family protein n=1 Tax=Nocardiopsis sp. MG754419 TaxID=2259865 RepID=UPI001BA72F62|nr:FtsX-like permease family protein [Nocardiopsis sp. MG754419]MBR8741162.1 ABC transporter permease [Nocardiopsis sp. MG754419]